MILFKHFKTICIHKFWVFYYCCLAGIPIQGIVHDLSKFSITEFKESIKYYTGDRSPIDKCKEENGYSMAWLHHRGRNKHHYEYWVDNFDKGGTSIKMPFKYALEMLCDYLGAGRAYSKDKFTIKGEIDWWNSKKDNAKSMHPLIKEFMNYALNDINNDIKNLNKKHMKSLYDSIMIESNKKVKPNIWDTHFINTHLINK